jgi:hypothetical protein
MSIRCVTTFLVLLYIADQLRMVYIEHKVGLGYVHEQHSLSAWEKTLYDQ